MQGAWPGQRLERSLLGRRILGVCVVVPWEVPRAQVFDATYSHPSPATLMLLPRGHGTPGAGHRAFSGKAAAAAKGREPSPGRSPALPWVPGHGHRHGSRASSPQQRRPARAPHRQALRGQQADKSVATVSVLQEKPSFRGLPSRPLCGSRSSGPRGGSALSHWVPGALRHS